MKDIQMLCMLYMFCVSCQRLQSCFLYVFEVYESAVQMPDQSIYGNRGVQMGTNRYFMLRRMVIFGTFMVHIGKNRMNPRFFRLYWVKKEQNKG
nr:MAG TPA: hypothetical protein [Caudoviricetes sp.]